MQAAPHPFFELCVETVGAARAAESGGANRVELCSQRACGGITPDPGLFKATIAAVSIPVLVLIRPRPGDFVFSPAEFTQMQRQIDQARTAGASGVAVGVLRSDGRVDVARTRLLVEQAHPMQVTFHRAFDETADLDQALDRIVETGVDALLTSGGAADVLTGADSLAHLAGRAAGRIHIVAGGGLRLSNLVQVVRRARAFALHSSLKRENGAADAATLEADVRTAVRILKQELDDFASARITR